MVVWRVNNFWRTRRFFFFWMLWFFNPFFRSVLIFLMFLGLLGLLSLLMFWGLFRVVGWRILLLRFPLPDCLQFFGLLMLFDFRFFVLGMPGSLLVLLWLVLLCFLLLGCCPLFPHYLKKKYFSQKITRYEGNLFYIIHHLDGYFYVAAVSRD